MEQSSSRKTSLSKKRIEKGKALSKSKKLRNARSRKRTDSEEPKFFAKYPPYSIPISRGNREKAFKILRINLINRAARHYGLSYSPLMKGLKAANIELNRKQLADLATNDAQAFEKILVKAFDIPSSKLLYSEKNEATHAELPGVIYLDTNKTELAEEFYRSILEVLANIGFELIDEEPAKFGSWIKKFMLKSKDVLTREEVVKRLDKVERAIELKHIDKMQSEVDSNTAQSIAKLIECTKDIPNFATLAGSLLFAKVTINGESTVFAHVLTQEQLLIARENPQLIYKPLELLNQIGLKRKEPEIVNFVTVNRNKKTTPNKL